MGTSGTSPFGNSGFNPNGLSIGGDMEGKGARTGINLWTERNYRAYREDEILDTRSIQIALKEIRVLQKEGRKEINIDKTVKRTCENGVISKSSKKDQEKCIEIGFDPRHRRKYDPSFRSGE